ncbi:MAG TPA: XRE family transcriptional regulator [Conexibacter sp.]
MTDVVPHRIATPSPEETGERLRRWRMDAQISQQELAQRLDLPVGTIALIEGGNVNPSVATLYAVVRALNVSLDDLFAPDGEPAGAGDSHAPPPGAAVAEARGDCLVLRRSAQPTMTFESGVRWERLTHSTRPQGELLRIFYPPGGASSPLLMRHTGREFGHVLDGRLAVTIGFERHELGVGDSISFDSTQPHRLEARGERPAVAIWFVTESDGDPRFEHA